MYIENPDLDFVYNEIFGIDQETKKDICHYGMPRRSGRYPWGSGEDPYQHSEDFLSRVEELQKQNFKFTDSDGKTWTGLGAVARSMGLTTVQLRSQIYLAKDEQRMLKVEQAKGLREKGYSLKQIADEMGYANDSSVRSLLNENSEIKTRQAFDTAEFLKKQVDEKKMVDIGTGVQYELNISKEKFDQAVEFLRMQGYNVYGGRMPQVTNPGQSTILRVLATPETKHKEIFEYGNIKSINDYISRDGGETFEKKFHYPASLDSKRLMIRYKEDGGIDKDGVIELRRGVDDLSLGNSHYSQVRILVDGNKYLKGMAIYSDDMPPGIDVIFNTNKSKTVPKMDVLKDVKKIKVTDPKTGKQTEIIDPENPFGSAIKDISKGGQYFYTDKNGKKQLGLINKRSDEGDWSEWKDKLPSQFLSKQRPALAEKQLGLKLKETKDEYESIMALTNPTVKKKLLQDFADGCDSNAVHLYAAALPRQKYHVIIPITNLKDNEIYAPKYNDGEQVALIRYPHGGTFEIPILTVNNKSSAAKKVMGPDFEDAVGINSKVAEQLSGADFDGDTVMVIPTNSKVRIKASPRLSQLDGFDPKMEYGTTKVKNPNYTGKKGEEEYFYYNKNNCRVKIMSNTQNEMGRISNLITDMTLKGADEDELARAVKHSMVVIDAEKHKLDYQTSERENNIAGLKKKYQEGGASTLISRAKSEDSIDKTQGSPKVNMKYKKNGEPNPDYDPNRPEGALIYKKSDNLYYPERAFNKTTKVYTLRTVNGKRVQYSALDKEAVDKYTPVEIKDKNGGPSRFVSKDGTIEYRVRTAKQKTTLMENTDDARTLISKENTRMENIYADFANQMKAYANQARISIETTEKIKPIPNAKKVYAKEVESLDKKLAQSMLNKPKERIAQGISNSVMAAKIKDNPDMSKEDIKKHSQRELSKAREMLGAKRTEIEITDEEWNAIQAGAISESKLKKILDNANMDVVREKATPRDKQTIPQSKINRIKSMQNQGLTIAEISKALNVSASTVSSYL